MKWLACVVLVKSGCALMACLIWLVQRIAERAAITLSNALTEDMLKYDTPPRRAAVSDGHKLFCSWFS